MESEAEIRGVIDRLATGFITKDSTLFASAFADVHDYVVINGTLVPNMTREANEKVHQELFQGTRMGALGNDLSKMGAPKYEIRNVRFVEPTVAVVHIGASVEGQDTVIASAVLHHQDGAWLIVSFHNAPVLAGGGQPG